MASSLVFVPTGESTPRSEVEARVLSLALHAFVASYLVGKAAHENPGLVQGSDEHRELLAGRMDVLMRHVMALYPTASALEELCALSALYDLDCTLVTPEVIH